MNWREFFKPDWRKSGIFLILFVVSPLIFFLNLSSFSMQERLRMIGYDLGAVIAIKLFYLLDYVLNLVFLTLTAASNGNGDIMLLGIALNIIYWYLISCLIVWIYDKLFRKVKRK
jgi:hypothetical protein